MYILYGDVLSLHAYSIVKDYNVSKQQYVLAPYTVHVPINVWSTNSADESLHNYIYNYIIHNYTADFTFNAYNT